jgi:hypothetical protein
MKTVHSVSYHHPTIAGPMGDYFHTFRSTNLGHAQDFAKDQKLYGEPAEVTTESDIPPQLFKRWRREGKLS